MDLHYSADQQAFRDEVRTFARGAVPQDIAAAVLRGEPLQHEHILRWQRILHAKGWGAPNWPASFGGPGWDPIRQHIFDEECALAGAPRQLPFGLRMVAPVLMRFGNAAQQERFLPRIPSGEDWWCQGYSEPGAGSDLAALKTRAERRGDVYIVNGQKTWTTLAQHADWIFCLVRTDPAAKKQEGISFLLINMRSPGIQVRPIRLLDGEAEVNEVWFDNVEVPVEQRVGDEHAGWTLAKYLLEHERTNIAGIGAAKRDFARACAVAHTLQRNGRPLMDDPLYAARVAELDVDLLALEMLNLRVVSAVSVDARDRSVGPMASMLKIKGSEIQQRIAEVIMDAGGAAGLPHYGVAAGQPEIDLAHYLNLRKTTIYGGANEIQRGIIARHLLEL